MTFRKEGCRLRGPLRRVDQGWGKNNSTGREVDLQNIINIIRHPKIMMFMMLSGKTLIHTRKKTGIFFPHIYRFSRKNIGNIIHHWRSGLS